MLSGKMIRMKYFMATLLHHLASQPQPNINVQFLCQEIMQIFNAFKTSRKKYALKLCEIYKKWASSIFRSLEKVHAVEVGKSLLQLISKMIIKVWCVITDFYKTIYFHAIRTVKSMVQSFLFTLSNWFES